MQITAFKAILARRINIQGYEDYENTFARMESDCTLRFRFKVLKRAFRTLKRFKVLKKCRNKFDCLVYEMLFTYYSTPLKSLTIKDIFWHHQQQQQQQQQNFIHKIILFTIFFTSRN